MAIGTVTLGSRLVASAQSRATPHYLPDRNIFSQDAFPFIATIMPGDQAGQGMGHGQQPLVVPGSGNIQSRKTYELRPSLWDYGTVSTKYTSSGAQATIVADTDATLAMSSASGLTKYMRLRNRRTGAIIQVRSVSGTTLTFKPFNGGLNGDGLDAILAGDVFDALGASRADGSQVAAGSFFEPVERNNYVQFDVTEVDMGDLAKVRKLKPDDTNGHSTDLILNARKHNEMRERNFSFGLEGAVTVGGETIYTMKGLDNWSDLEYDIGGTLTKHMWDKVVSPQIFQAGGGSKKRALGGNTVLSVINNLMESKVAYTQFQQEFGTSNVKTLGAPMGSVTFMGSQVWHERDGEFLCYDPDLLVRMYYEGYDMVLLNNMAPNDYFKSTDVWASAETLLVKNPEHIVKITGCVN